MDISKANYFLGKVITGFQDDEIHDLTVVLREADGSAMECMDCEYKFKKKKGQKRKGIKCPKCGSFDVEIA